MKTAIYLRQSLDRDGNQTPGAHTSPGMHHPGGRWQALVSNEPLLS